VNSFTAIDRPRRSPFTRVMPGEITLSLAMKRALLAVFAALSCNPDPAIRAAHPDGGGSGPGPAIDAPTQGVGTDGPGLGFTFPDASAVALDARDAAGPSSMSNCGIKRINLERHPADLLLVLDRSGSMAQTIVPVGGTVPVKKWDEVTSALDVTLMRTQGLVNWGLHLFPVGPICNVPDVATVAVAPKNHTPVMAAIRGNQPYIDGGATPTQAAIRKATAIMQQRQTMNPRYLVLATDGLPNCAAGMGGSDMATDRAGTTAAITEAAAAGMPTFVIGIATPGEADAVLNEMADAGGRPRMDPTTHYYPVASKDQLIDALTTIAGQVASCTFPLDPLPPVPSNVAVELNGTRLMRDDTRANGWTYAPDGKSIVLVGAACQRLMDGTATDVQILYGCPDVVIP
jgi:hypothetical protein